MDSVRKRIKNDLFFFVFGLFLPVNILFYRIVCKLFFSSFVFVNSAVFDTVFFCYFPTLLLFPLLYKKDSNFFMKKFEYLKWVLTLYSLAAKVHCYFYEKIMVFFCFLLLYFCAYLFTSYNHSLFEILFLFLRQIFISFCAFKHFFGKECKSEKSICIERLQNSPFFNSFLTSYIYLKSEEKQTVSSLFCSLNSFVFLCLLRENNKVIYIVKNYEAFALKSLSSLQDNINQGQYNDLWLEKNKIFSFPEKPPLFYFLASDVFTNLSQKCELYCEKLEDICVTCVL